MSGWVNILVYSSIKWRLGYDVAKMPNAEMLRFISPHLVGWRPIVGKTNSTCVHAGDQVRELLRKFLNYYPRRARIFRPIWTSEKGRQIMGRSNPAYILKQVGAFFKRRDVRYAGGFDVTVKIRTQSLSSTRDDSNSCSGKEVEVSGIFGLENQWVQIIR